ncbi:MAG: hypothetical protein HIU83_09475 [Proteobacteria bacterium]|nr:hypothetical protein [Pseudomonadota bacterium]
MKIFLNVIPIIALALIAALPLSAAAAGGKVAKSEVVMKMGDKVHLFHSSNVPAQKEIAVGDVLPVYRVIYKGTSVSEAKSGKTFKEKEVGQVKVLSFFGEHYFEAVIIKGNVQKGDIAKKGGTALLVQSPREADPISENHK